MIAVDGVQVHEDLKPLLVKATLLREHPENARQGDVAAIKESMRENGVYKPVVAQRSTGYVIVGNHTYRSMTELGAQQVPTTWLDVDDEQARRIMLADNRTSELGSYDEIQLADLLTGLSDGGSLFGTGYSDDDLSDLLVGMEAPPAESGLAGKKTSLDKESKYNEDGATTTAGFVDGQRKVVGRRMVVLDLPIPVWLWLMGHLETLAKDWGADSNAEVVLGLVARYTGTEAPVVETETAA